MNDRATFSTTLAIVGLLALILSLGSTFWAMWTANEHATTEALNLTKLLLDWKVIAGGLLVGGTKTFQVQLKKRIEPKGTPPNTTP